MCATALACRRQVGFSTVFQGTSMSSSVSTKTATTLRKKHISVITLAIALAAGGLATATTAIETQKLAAMNKQSFNIDEPKKALDAFHQHIAGLMSVIQTASAELEDANYQNPPTIDLMTEELGRKFAAAKLIDAVSFQKTINILQAEGPTVLFDNFTDKLKLVMADIETARDTLVASGLTTNTKGFDTVMYRLTEDWANFMARFQAVKVVHEEMDLVATGASLLDKADTITGAEHTGKTQPATA